MNPGWALAEALPGCAALHRCLWQSSLSVMPLATLMVVLLSGFLARRRTDEFTEATPVQPDLTA